MTKRNLIYICNVFPELIKSVRLMVQQCAMGFMFFAVLQLKFIIDAICKNNKWQDNISV